LSFIPGDAAKQRVSKARRTVTARCAVTVRQLRMMRLTLSSV